jgi:flagellar basal-body rod protein FlgF
MSTGIWSAASGAVAQTTALDIAANNIANASTPGYRADRAIFRQELNQAQGAAAATKSMKYSIVRTVEADRRQGTIVSTGRSLDVALKDPNHWFRISTPQGIRYTRAGSVQMAADGALRTSDGAAYVDASGRPIRVRSDAQSAAIGPDGSVTVDGVDSGQKLSVASFTNPGSLVKEGTVAMRALPNSEKPKLVSADLETGAVESSNASLLTGMTSLVQSSREFEMMTRVIDAFSNIEHRTAQEVGSGK